MKRMIPGLAQSEVVQERQESWGLINISDIVGGQTVSFTIPNDTGSTPDGVFFVYGTYSYDDDAGHAHSKVRFCQEYVGDIGATVSCLHREEVRQANKNEEKKP